VNTTNALGYDADCITCDNCGDKTRSWDYAPDYSKFCLECLAGLEDPDDDNARADWEYERMMDE
jgi:hypothetical protein